MRYYFILILCISVKISFAQDTISSQSSVDNMIFRVVEVMPQFPGGNDSLKKFIYENMQYPAMAKELKIAGTVWIQFFVDKNGNVQNVEVIRGIEVLDAEAIRLAYLMPAWIPGKQKNKTVNVYVTLPIHFDLNKINPTPKFNSSLQVFTTPQVKPKYPGGEEAMNHFISSKLKYPKKALKEGLQDTVIVQFVILESGYIDHIEIKKGNYSPLNKEAIKIISKMPKWEPGEHMGRPVMVLMEIPIIFEI